MAAIRIDLAEYGRIRIRMPYDPVLIAQIKAMPSSRRSWEPQSKAWVLHHVDDAHNFVAQAGRRGHPVIGAQQLGGYEPPAHRPAVTAASPIEVFEHLLRIVGPDHEDKIHKALSRVLHPDTGGSTELMTALNAARDRHISRNCRRGGQW